MLGRARVKVLESWLLRNGRFRSKDLVHLQAIDVTIPWLWISARENKDGGSIKDMFAEEFAVNFLLLASCLEVLGGETRAQIPVHKLKVVISTRYLRGINQASLPLEPDHGVRIWLPPLGFTERLSEGQVIVIAAKQLGVGECLSLVRR